MSDLSERINAGCTCNRMGFCWHCRFAVEVAEIEAKYYELLWAVEKKFPNESRHETALRYITEQEQTKCESPAKESVNE